MSIYVEEKFRGRTRSKGRNASAEIAYIIRATAGEDDNAIEAALFAESPGVYAGLVKDGIGLLEELNSTNIWEGTVRYSATEMVKKKPGEKVITFKTTGGKQKIQFSQRTRAPYWKAGTNLIDFKNVLNVRSGGEAEGIDIEVPIFEWHERHVFTDAKMSDGAYISTLYELTGTVNKDQWRIFGPNDLLFLGVEGSTRDDGNWEVEFSFAAATTREIPNIGGITAANGGPIVKRGWDYLWVYYRLEELAISGGGSPEKVLLPVAQQVNVEEIYDEGNFPDLGIGT